MFIHSFTMCPLSRTITKQIFSTLYRERRSNVRRTILRKLYTNKPEGRFSSFVPFSEMMERRREEAGRSIIVQIKNKKSFDDLITYCSKFGSVKNAFFYSKDHQSNYVIVEYDDRESSQAAVAYASISDAKEAVPVTSSFLWLRADLNMEPPRTGLLSLQRENNEVPTFEVLQSELSASSSFSNDVVILYNRLRLTETGYRLRYITALQIETALKGMFANNRILPFGSSTNTFGKVDCDLDLVLEFNILNTLPKTSRLRVHSKPMNALCRSQRHLEIIADLLQYFLPGCSNVRRILRARVPIIKYKHDFTGIECDLSGTNLSGVFMSEWLYLCSSYDERVCPLVFAVRFWASELHITNSNCPGKWISNFSLSLLVLFFLQCEKIIPTLDTLMKFKRPQDTKLIDEYDCGFLSDLRLLSEPDTKQNNDNLLTLLFKFFEFYSSFDSRSYALSLNSGSMIPKPLYEPLYIVNPLEKGLNVSRNVTSEEFERFRKECRNAVWNIECSMNAGSPSSDKWGFLDFIQAQKSTKNFSPRMGMKGATRLAVKQLFQDDKKAEC